MAGTRTQPLTAPTRPKQRRRQARWRFAGYDRAGLAMAIVFFCLSLTPSLLPRVWWLQGLQSGVLAATAYGLGVLMAWIVHRLLNQSPRPAPTTRTRVLAGRVLAGVTAALVLLFLWLGASWQRQIYQLMGTTPPSRYRFAGVLLVAAVVFVALVGLARLLRRTARWVARHAQRAIPPRAATVVGALAAALLVYGIVDGVLLRGLMSAANETFKTLNGEDKPEVSPPSGPDSSGGPGSLAAWSSLGREGRAFVSGAPSVAELGGFAGTPARPPIRVYAGLDSAPTPHDQAALVVAELQRTGAFSRRVLCVANTTGTGWVDDNGVSPLEYMYVGDTAIAAMQYSYLPSWLSFLVDRGKARTAGRELFNQVYAAWSALPADRRPRLAVFGESLGSFGGEAAFSGAEDIRNRTGGVLFEGPPNSNALWSEFVAAREPGTREVLPVYQRGVTVRFGETPADLALPPAPWPPPRMVYLQHASDPITWWSPRLLLHRPDWLAERRGADVLPAMRWYPLVTFWQVSADMVFSTGVPPGHGHSYGAQSVAGWADIVAPPDWTEVRTAQLTAVLERTQE